MRRAVELSRHGWPAPNPHVGCVIVKDGVVVGQGFHDHAGGPHAEIVALQKAGALAAGADVYVTLEPCNHTGRTGPCSEALIGAGVKRVLVAVPDPNVTAGGGIQKLRSHGIEVSTGLEEADAKLANKQFLLAHELGRPVVVAKCAVGLDGRASLANADSKWITGTQAREAGRRLRAECGSVLVGYKTVLADDPELTARIPGVVNQPLRIVLDPHRRLTGREKVFSEAASTVHVTDPEVTLSGLLDELWAKNVRGILVEGGPTTLSRFVRAGFVDRVEIFIGPKLLGNGPSWFSDDGVLTLAAARELRIERCQMVGEDLQISACF